MIEKELTYDLVVVGGGMSGICAAIAGARNGIKVALVHNRPVLGGNASSEIRMHICGADCHGSRPNARETGILEEILLENRHRNPQYSYSVFDSILWEKVHYQEGLDLYLNTHFTKPHVSDGHIVAIEATQLTSETSYIFKSTYYADTTGDGTLAYSAGCDIMLGREAKDTYGEEHAPDEADPYTMGSTLLFTTKDMGRPVPVQKPIWANTYTEDDLIHRGHGAHGHNYWWIEIGGQKLNTITDSETIRDELVKAVYGVWDHIKNGGDHGADNYVLDWIGFLPGKRESRRIVGDYVLKEQDLVSSRVFDDAIGYGGWHMDMHVVGGINTPLEPTEYILIPEVYTIPYRSIYAKDIDNLFIGGRVISASHMAFGSTRIMGTCSILGQAIGVSAAIAKKNSTNPCEASKYIKEIQQLLLRDDAYIPHYANEDNCDIARTATVTCSSEKEGYEGELVINGVARTVKQSQNLWCSDGITKDGEWLKLNFDMPTSINSIEIKFDSNLSKPIIFTLFNDGLSGEDWVSTPIELVKDYEIIGYLGERVAFKKKVSNNYQRLNKITLEKGKMVDSVTIRVISTHGCEDARIFEVRIYKMSNTFW